MFILSGAVACRDTTNVPQEASTPNLSLSQTMGVSLHSNAALGPGSDVSVAEEASAESLARALAIALGDRTLRQSVKAALATSAGNEHKLHFATFMQGRGAISTPMAAAAQRSRKPSRVEHVLPLRT